MSLQIEAVPKLHLSKSLLGSISLNSNPGKYKTIANNYCQASCLLADERSWPYAIFRTIRRRANVAPRCLQMRERLPWLWARRIMKLRHQPAVTTLCYRDADP